MVTLIRYGGLKKANPVGMFAGHPKADVALPCRIFRAKRAAHTHHGMSDATGQLSFSSRLPWGTRACHGVQPKPSSARGACTVVALLLPLTGPGAIPCLHTNVPCATDFLASI